MTSSRNSSLVHEVHDNFDFEPKIFDVESSGNAYTHNNKKSNGNLNSIDTNHLSINSPVGLNNNLNSLNAKKNGIEKHTHTKNSPSTSGPSYFSSNFDENGYVFDGIKIDIEDIDNTSVSNITTQSLKRCKSQVLKHYYCLLVFIGWRPFYKEHYYRTPFLVKIFNIIYPLLIVGLLLYSYVHDVITCQGKLNIYYDTQYVPPATFAPALTRGINRSSTTTEPSFFDEFKDKFFETNHDSSSSTPSSYFTSLTNQFAHSNQNNAKSKENTCGHVVTTYIIPSVLHLVAYIIGFIYFRINENEQLYALMEKVFLAVNQTLKVVSQDRVIRRLKVFIILGVLWVILAVSTYLLSRLVFDLDRTFFYPTWASILIEMVALIIVNSVYLAVVINHATQCEMIIFYVNEIRTRLEEKSITLKEAMQQILDIRMALGNLNSTISKMATLVSLNFVEKFIIGMIILIMNRVTNPYIWVYRSLFTVSWLLIMTFTLTQIARLNSVCSKFIQIALSSRVYGYHASARDELDSFLLFVANAKLRAKLFGIPLKPSVILATVITISFTLIILFQSSVISTPDSII